MYTDPTISDFKTFFVRDFPFGADINEHILDADITNAIQIAGCIINPNLFPKQEIYTIGFLWLVAHHLTVAIRASSQGISGSFQWPQNSRSVGSVSESLAIPSSIMENPNYSGYMATSYGGEYLMLVLPLLRGQIFTVQGATHA